MAEQFPSIKAQALLAILSREPLNYAVTRQSGSHRRLKSPGRPPLTFAFHDGATVSPRAVREILVKTIGLDETEARDLL